MRTFLAIDLDDAILDRMAGIQSRIDDPGSKINWVDRENLHITLNFLGDVPDELLTQVCDVAAAVAGQIQPFEIEVAGLTVTPPRGSPRMFWADVEDPTGSLTIMHEQLDAGLYGLGLRQEERNFRPHITLARIKYAANPAHLRRLAGELAHIELGFQHVEELVAYASQLTSEGPIYTAIARCPLK